MKNILKKLGGRRRVITTLAIGAATVVAVITRRGSRDEEAIPTMGPPPGPPVGR